MRVVPKAFPTFRGEPAAGIGILALLIFAGGAKAAFPGENGQIAFVSDRGGTFEIHAMDPDGAGQVALTAAEGANPAYSPDGQTIAFSSSRSGGRDIFTMAANGLSETAVIQGPHLEDFPAFDLAGDRLAFSRSVVGADSDLYSAAASGGSDLLLVDDPSTNTTPRYHPLQPKIAFSSNRDGDFEIFTMNVNGTAQTPLTDNTAADVWPDYSPDGSQIVFGSDRDGDFEIYIMDSDGGNQTQLTDTGIESGDIQPFFSPDGTRIGFASDRDGDVEIFTMATDGSDLRQLTSNGFNDFGGDWQPGDFTIVFSLDGKGKQKVKKLEVDASCAGESCDASISGDAKIKISKKGKNRVVASKAKKFALKETTTTLPAGSETTIKIGFQKKKAIKKMRKLLKDKQVRKKSKLKLTVEATDAVGNTEKEKLKIKLKR